MRKVLLPALALAFCAPLAHADTYNFSFSGQNGEDAFLGIYAPYSISFDVTTNPVPGGSGSFGNVTFFTLDAPTDGGGPFSTGPTNYATFYSNGSFDLFESDLPISRTAGSSGQTIIADPSIFSGTATSPAFNQETVSAINVFSPSQSYNIDYDSFLTITDLSTAATPEPATLALLGTGLLAGCTALRRRL